MSERPTGDVISVIVHEGDELRVTVECQDHHHSYELAWKDTPDGRVITDMRIRSTDGTPITSRSLARINTRRLVAATWRYDTRPVAADPTRGQEAPPRRKPGRPGLPDTHYETVAMLARRAAQAGSRSIAKDVMDEMRKRGSVAALGTVQAWIKVAKKRRLIGPNELRRARRTDPG